MLPYSIVIYFIIKLTVATLFLKDVTEHYNIVYKKFTQQIKYMQFHSNSNKEVFWIIIKYSSICHKIYNLSTEAIYIIYILKF